MGPPLVAFTSKSKLTSVKVPVSSPVQPGDAPTRVPEPLRVRSCQPPVLMVSSNVALTPP